MTEPLSPAASADSTSTERLYWTQPQQRHFTAVVSAVEGRRVALDRTLYYPEGGGQSCDAGTLSWRGAASQVTDVQKEGAVIWHTVSGDAPPAGTEVTGELDWTRRYRHSQRHSAEHLLAQAFFRVNPAFGVRSVSMRGPECTLDLAGQPGESHVRAAQMLLTEILREELSLETLVVDAADLHAYPLRRPPQVQGSVRVVLFRTPDGEIWDASACGGTHLPRGVQAAPVVVLRTERVKGDLTRITFMAGEEATERLNSVYTQTQTLARGFSVGVERLPEQVDGLRSELASTRSRLLSLHRELAAHLLGQASWVAVPGGELAFVQTETGAGTLPPVEQLELVPHLLELASERPASVVVALTPGGDCGVASTLPGYPAGALLREWLACAGGRGGGRPELARGRAERPNDFGVAVRDWLLGLS